LDGIDLLGHFGLNLVVIPHWNNAEGGTHDTRFCYMGAPRFRELEALLPEDVIILGLDEHTACVMDLARQAGTVKGIGRVTVRHGGSEAIFEKGESFSLDRFRAGMEAVGSAASAGEMRSIRPEEPRRQDSFWEAVHALEAAFLQGLEQDDARAAVNALLELDGLIWKAHLELEDPELIAQAREIMRELMVFLSMQLTTAPRIRREWLSPLVDQLLLLRESFRHNKQWREADAVRECLNRAEIMVEDTPGGPRWQLLS
jgi:hypothetical protein